MQENFGVYADSMPDCDDGGMADDCLGRTGQGTVNTYRNGDGVLAGAPCEAQAVAAVFTADRNADGAELLDSIDFYAHVDDGSKATATVEYYKDVEGMAPDAGTSIFQKEVSVKERILIPQGWRIR